MPVVGLLILNVCMPRVTLLVTVPMLDPFKYKVTAVPLLAKAR